MNCVQAEQREEKKSKSKQINKITSKKFDKA